MKLKATVFLLSIFLFGNTCAGVKLTPNETFTNPKKQLEVSGIKRFQKSDTILVPGIMLHALVEGQHKASKGGAHAKANFAISNLSPELGEAMATEIYTDLVTKLIASGWKIITYEDSKDHKGWGKIAAPKNLKVTGLPGLAGTPGFSKNVWMTSYPSNGAKIAAGKTGEAPIHKIHGEVAKSLKANLLFPIFRYDGPVGYGSTGKGYKKSTASAGISPAMDLNKIRSGFYNVKGGFGWISLKDGLRVSENIGDIEQVNGSSSANTSLFSFETFRSVAKGDYLLTLNEAEYKKAILQSATDYNTLLVEALIPALPKK